MSPMNASDVPIDDVEPDGGDARRPTRRDALTLLGGAGAFWALAACGGSSSKTSSGQTGTSTTVAATTATTATTAPATSVAGATPPPAAGATVACVMTPEMTEGPYYIANEAIRSDITDGKDGVPLSLDLIVLDASSCQPVPNATVEIWHADAGGVYSGFGSGASSRTFLRGVQVAGADGKVTFRTVYPGWYQGRATHVHLKAQVNGTVHTSQLFFEEAINNAVYAKAPYNGHSGTRTLNAQDGIYSGGGSSTVVKLSPSGSGYGGAVNLGVKT